jgi:hypothetical protein
MALRFCDSFDHYDTAHLIGKWTLFPSSSSDATIGTTSARNGGQALAVTRSGVAKTVDNISTWIVGGAFNWTAYGGGVSLINVITATTNWAIQGDGTIKVSGPGGSLGQTNPIDAISLNKYYYVEMKTVLHSSTGSVEIRINGQSKLTVSGVNTAAANNADVVNVSGPGGGVICYVDDFYVCDGSGSNNNFLGDVQIGILKPRAEGDKLEWVPNGTGTVHFSRVNETPPDDDTSYVSSTMTGTSTTGPSDLYLFDTVSTTRLVLGVQTNIFARKDDEGNRAISVLTSNASTISQGDPTGRYVNLTYIDYLNQFDVNPIGSGTWSPTVMNTMQWGVEVVV